MGERQSQRLTPQEFVKRWNSATLTERSGSQQHFMDLCRMLGQPTPAEADPHGDFYTFEKGVEKGAAGSGKGRGFADVFYRGRFAWEYKGKHKDLDAAYDQLQLYREALESPPLMIVCDMHRYRVHTNFTNTATAVYSFTNEGLLEEENRKILRLAFEDPEALRPGRTVDVVTREAAEKFARLADDLRERGYTGERAAGYLDRLLFALFAEDVGLLPKGIFSEILSATRRDPDLFVRYTSELFEAMAGGGHVLLKPIKHFDGGLFEDAEVLPLSSAEISVLAEAAALDWGSVEPAVFGTLFERSLDPQVRVPLGAHYTSREDILAIVEPVLMAPLRRKWQETRDKATELYERAREAKGGPGSQTGKRNLAKAESVLVGFAEELRSVTVLDPACGSGNFLYVALSELLGLEKEVSAFASTLGLTPFFPGVSPEQLKGIEVNAYAHELAQVSIWIGYLQWMMGNGFGAPKEPILGPMDNVLLMDAIVGNDESGELCEPEWPAADVIVGNPPFLGGKYLRSGLDDEYVEAMFSLYDDRVAHESDLVCYFFEKARAEVAGGRVDRAGLLATNSIRGGANRKVLSRIRESGSIFFAESDRPWVLDGAAVRVSMVGFDAGVEHEKVLDGAPVENIYANLTGDLDLTEATLLTENSALAFMGDTKGGPFDLDAEAARRMLAASGNPNGRPNSEVVKPWVNGLDITRRPRGYHIVDFGVEMAAEEAALYEAPFEHVAEHVKPMRQTNKRKSYRDLWWLHVEPRPAMRQALAGLPRFLATPTVAKHRLFVWLDGSTLPDHQLIVFALEDDYSMGLLHSRVHELWSLRMGTSLEDRPRYTPTTCFETFPFPEPTEEQKAQISEAARRLDELRMGWLNPEDASGIDLKKRTLTNLYNERPSWLAMAHGRLDRAVYAAYGWSADITDEHILANLLALNRTRSGRA